MSSSMPTERPTCVIFNPSAGRGRAARLLHSLQQSQPTAFELCPTERPGHAIELARAAAEAGCPVVVAAGGDGTVHEVANGILLAGRNETIFSVWPFGSANDYAFALGVKRQRWQGPPAGQEVRSVDVGRIEAAGKSVYFVNCSGIGFNGGVTLESRRIRWLRGMPLYGLATWRALWRHFDQPVMRLELDDFRREAPTLALSVNLGPREGNFPITPKAQLDDGLFDVVHAGPLTRWQALKWLPRMATGTLPTDDPRLWQGRCRRATVESSAPLRVHADGEFFCHPEDGVRQVTIEVLPGRLRVLGASSKAK
jgi:diacylglycerol kinase (ATP)